MKIRSRLILTILALSTVFMSAGPVVSQESDPVSVKVGGVQANTLTHSATVLLYAATERLILPIYIGISEAGAISRYLDGASTPRPMTHDLISNLLDVFDGHLEQVIVSDFRDSNYLALLVIRRADKEIRVDARPSDAIAVALKQGVPIVVERKVLEALGILHDNYKLVPPQQQAPAVKEIPPADWI